MQFQNPMAFLLLLPLLVALVLIVRHDFVSRLKRSELRSEIVKQRGFIILARAVILVLLVVAIASPFSFKTILKSGDATLTLLVDNSSSMELLDSSFVSELKGKLEARLPVRFRTFGSGDLSPVGDAILANINGNDNILLVSDGRGNAGRSVGDMSVLAAAMNSTVNAISLSPVRDDTYVTIAGPRITTNAEDNDFLVVVSQVGSPRDYQLVVSVDSEEVLSSVYSGGRVATITKKFAEGYHTIKAEVTINDNFAQNNVFYKTVKVEQKPRVLFVSKKDSPLLGIFNTLYRTSVISDLSGQPLDGYSAVVLNDIPAPEVPVEQLSQYVIDGNGLVVIGGKSSYDRGGYKDSLLEGMLPVQVGKGKEGQRTDVSVALVIDISGSTGSGFGESSVSTIEEVEKALSISVLNGLRKQDKVAVIAFNTDAFIVSDLVPVLGNQEYLSGRIERLVYKGGTRIDEGIKAARRILAPLEGSKSMIIFSDGKSGSYPDDLYDAQISGSTGIKIYTIGVGEGTNRKHLQDIANAGNGYYFEPAETERLKVLFGEPEESPSDSYPLEVVNGHHFITASFNPSAKVNGFNQVVPKPNADLLVATDSNNPIISASRLGLGRIVAVSTDDGSAWAPELLNSRNSVLLSRSVNWAVGDLGRNKDFDVDVKDVYLGDEMDVNIVSSSEPEHRTLSFSKIGKRLYTSSFTPQSSGILEFFDATAAVNYPKEYAALGMNPDLERSISVTGGKLFNPSDVEGIVSKVKEDSRRVVSEPVTYSWVFLLAALLVFLFDVAVRKIREGRQK